MARFSSVRSLFGGTALSSPPEEDEDEGVDANERTQRQRNAGPTPAAVDAAIAGEVDKAVSAERARCVAVIGSEAGAANPKAAARMLGMANGAASAEEIIASLAELGGKTPDAAAAAARLEEDRQRLANDKNADPKTGPAGGSPQQRAGEGDDGDKHQAAKDNAAAAAKRRNNAALAKGGKQVGA